MNEVLTKDDIKALNEHFQYRKYDWKKGYLVKSHPSSTQTEIHVIDPKTEYVEGVLLLCDSKWEMFKQLENKKRYLAKELLENGEQLTLF